MLVMGRGRGRGGRFDGLVVVRAGFVFLHFFCHAIFVWCIGHALLIRWVVTFNKYSVWLLRLLLMTDILMHFGEKIGRRPFASKSSRVDVIGFSVAVTVVVKLDHKR